MDPLTFATDVLAVAVFDAPLFDAEFAGLVALNAEGRVITRDGTGARDGTGDGTRAGSGGQRSRLSGRNQGISPAGRASARRA